MATQTIESNPRVLADEHDPAKSRDANSPLELVLAPLASLKLTVVLFALAILLVFASTLAQHHKGIWQVVDEYYSHWFAFVAYADLVPPAFTMSLFDTHPQLSGGFYFPGGVLIGVLMAVNLLAAHAVRFRVRAVGSELAVGLSILAVGIFTTWLVIASGSNKDGFQHAASIEWPTLWKLVKIGVGALFLSALYGTILVLTRAATPYWWRGLCVFGTLGLAALFVFVLQTRPLSDSAMRILWQLLKAQIAASILLAGCIPIFKKRAGIVVLHAGVGLMLTQLFLGVGVVEAQMHIEEGQTVNYAQDIRSVELAVIDGSPDQAHARAFIPEWLGSQDRPLTETADNVTAVPGSLLAKRGRRIRDERLPFEIEVLEFQPNSKLYEIPAEGRETPATAGAGLRYYAARAALSSGTGSEVDIASAYVRFFDHQTGEALGTYLVSQHLKPQSIQVGEKTWELDLRFRRDYKPYTVTLKDIEKRDYIGTSTPRDYSSYVVLRDPSRNVDREIRIWMNNPLRYAGETFYQSSYHPLQYAVHRDPKTGEPLLNRVTGEPLWVEETDPTTGERRRKVESLEATTLQVVANTGWMIPYVACMIVLTGMLAHFSIILMRFLNRRAVEEAVVAPGALSAAAHRPAESPHVKAARRAAQARGAAFRKLDQPEPDADDSGSWLGDWQSIAAWVVAAVLLLLAAGYALGKLAPPKPTAAGLDIHAFGELPVVAGGRAKPFDSLARNSLQQISGRETFVGRMDFPRLKEKWDDIEQGLRDEWERLSDEDLLPFRKRIETAQPGRPPAPSGAPDQQLDSPHKFAADLIDMIADRTGDRRVEIARRVDELTMEKQPAIRWLLDSIAKPGEAIEHRVVRIENLDVISSLGLERRPGYRYAMAELQDKLLKVGQQAARAHALQKEAGADALDTYQRKILELEKKVGVVVVLMQSFSVPEIRAGHAREDLNSALLDQQRLVQQGPPLVVPPADEDEQWQTFGMASLMTWVQTHVYGRDPEPAYAALATAIAAYANADADKFNASIDRYWTALKADKPEELNLTRTGFEAFYNRFAPLFSSIWLYLSAFLVAAVGWLGWSRPLNWTSLSLVAFTFGVHTFGLISRIYISGRPPVTNLYSSAVFIAWGMVLLGIIVELIYRRGIGNVIAAVSGFASLLIAWYLSVDGDTFTVLQAVLDTQFWLATHVTCITFGYAATFVAGLLGLIYILRGARPAPLVVGLALCGLAWHFFTGSTWEYATYAGVFSVLGAVSCLGAGTMMLAGGLRPEFSAEDRRTLTRMTYGTLCFAIFFSFVGTVLGGLWADDSWGRFWGWDPKENGALIIVLWNALVLHARWDGWIKDRGLAVLAIGGNIVTSWSWFGVNELGLGLHSYGFTDGVLLTLGLFWLSQVAVIALGCLPKRLWWHHHDPHAAAA